MMSENLQIKLVSVALRVKRRTAALRYGEGFLLLVEMLVTKDLRFIRRLRPRCSLIVLHDKGSSRQTIYRVSPCRPGQFCWFLMR